MEKPKMEKEKREYWGNQGSGIILQAEDTCNFLLSKRSAYVNEPNTIGNIGGRIEEGETNKEGAIRELSEETDIQINKDSLEELSIYKDDDKFIYTTFIAEIPKEIPIQKHTWENDEFLWVSLNEMKALPNKHFGLQYILEHASDKLSELTTKCKKQRK